MSYTPGTWRVGAGSFVIADSPAPGISGADDVAYYGGHLICESVNQPNALLIAAAPDLLDACKELPIQMLEREDSIDASEFVDRSDRFMRAMRKARAAMVKAGVL